MSTLNERIKARKDGVDGDAGFTLIELMVVLLIMAILLAIAIPTFLGVTKSANDRAAQSNLNTALVNAKAAYQQNGQTYAIGTASTSYATNVVATLASAEPSLTFVAGVPTTQGQVSVYVAPDGSAIILASQAKATNNCWFIVDNTATGGEAINATNAGFANFTSWTSGGGTSGSQTTVAAGSWYGEVKGANANACNAGALPAASATTALSSTGFPAL